MMNLTGDEIFIFQLLTLHFLSLTVLETFFSD